MGAGRGFEHKHTPRGWGITQLNCACIPGMNKPVLHKEEKKGIKLVEGGTFDCSTLGVEF